VRVIRYTVIGLFGTVAFAVLAASIVLQGPRLGRLIEGALPPNQGKMHIGGVTWRLRALVDIVTDEPSPISVDGLQIVDPEGTVVLDVPHLDAKVKLRTLIGGSFSIHDLRVPVALWRFAQLQHGDGIGFLAALQPKNPPPPPPPGTKPKGPGSYFEIASAELGDLNAIFDFPGSWGLELRHAHARASLKQSGVDPEHPTFGFDAGPVVAAGGGWLRILDDNVLPFDRVVINRIATTPDWSDDIFLDLAEADTGRTKLVGKGFFTGIYGPTSTPGIKLHAAFAEAGDALSAVVAGKGIEGLKLSGDGATVTADLHETFAKLKVEAAFRGLDVQYDTYRALGLGLDLGFDAGAGRVDVGDLGFGAPGGGRFRLDAHLDINKMALEAGLALTDFHTESYLPKTAVAMGGGRLTGKIDARADLTRKSARLPRIELRLARAHAAGLPKDIRVHGSALVSPERLRTDGITVAVTGAEATARGSVDLERQALDLGLAVVAGDLGKLLGEMGLPPLAKDARLDAHAGGTFDDPEVAGDATVRGVSAAGRRLPELVVKFGLDHGVARLDKLSGPAFGGRLDGHGTLQLWEKRASRPLRSPVLDVKLEARDLDLATLTGSSDVGGRVSLQVDAHGPLDAVDATVEVPGGTPVTLLGESYALGPVDLALSGKTLAIRKLHLARGAGGALDVSGQVGLEHQDLAVDVVLDKLPLAGLPGVADSGVPVEGTVSAAVHVGGRPERPQLAGNVDLAGVVARGVHLGAGHLTLAATKVGPTGAPGVAVTGRLFDRFGVDARAALGPKGPSVHGELDFRRLEIETLAPELLAFNDGRGVVSGKVAVDIEPGQPLALDVLLPELWLSVARTVDGPIGEKTTQRVRVEAARPLHVSVRGDRVVLDEAHFATDGGDLKVEGRLDGRHLAGSLDGHLDLELVEPFIGAGGLDRLTGDLKVQLQADGTLDKPLLRGEVAIVNPVRVRPKEFDRDVVIGSGMITLDADGAAIRDLAVTVDGATMRFSGRAGLGPGFVPENIEADVDGDVSARLLAFAAPDAVTDAQGRAHVRARLRGTLTKPEVRGRLDLSAIDFRLRDLGTEVQVASGIVEISNDGLILHNVKVQIGDQGALTIGASGIRAGRVQFSSLIPFKPGKIDLPLHGEQLTYLSPSTFEVDDLSFDLDMRGSLDEGLALGGEVRLVTGRYLQDFKVQDLVITPRVNESSVRPFYEGKPLLENLDLDLTVRTVGDGFVVQNNIAPEIHIDILLHIGGTLAAPQLAGDVRPTDGRFNIPFMRGDFDLVPNVNHITFVATKSVADGDTPDLNIQAQNLVTDSNGNDHNVHMSISGPLREAQIDLFSDDGLDRNQCALLLLTGRTANESQRLATQNPTVGANVGTAGDVAGQATRDTVASLMEPYIDDTFMRLTGLNLRLTVGSDGAEARVRKRISRYLNFQTDYLQGFQNNSNWKTQLDFWVLDYISVGSGLEQIRTSAQQGVPETLPLNYKLELRLDYAIRW
jgi:hypothetical protein